MNIFIPYGGSSRTLIFIQGCHHITNDICAHESRSGMLGYAYFNFQRNHTKAEVETAWLLHISRLADRLRGRNTDC